MNNVLEVNREFQTKYINQFDTPEYERVLEEKTGIIREGSVYNLETFLMAVRRRSSIIGYMTVCDKDGQDVRFEILSREKGTYYRSYGI